MGGHSSTLTNVRGQTYAKTCQASSSQGDSHIQYMIQNYFLIWVDASIDESVEDHRHTLRQLRKIVNKLITCTEASKCTKYLTDAVGEKAFVISSGSLGPNLVSQIHDMKQVYAIYIFCADKTRHEQWARKWPKIEGVFTSIIPICTSLKAVVRQCDYDITPMSMISKDSDISTINTSSAEISLDHLDPSYMYTMLFKDIIFQIDDDDDKSMQTLITYCCDKGIGQSELDHFQNIYRRYTPIRCYTEETFLYSMLNKALRSLDLETMIKMGFFIKKLHEQLIQLHQEQSNMLPTTCIVYRGQGLSQEDFTHLLNTKGGLLAFNYFLSTSTEQNVAITFVKENLRKFHDNVGVVFVMTIDQRKVSALTTPFAFIEKYSAVPIEKEILFSMHTVFRIVDIKRSENENNPLQVELTITDADDPQLTGLTTFMKNELHGRGWYRMGRLMLHLKHSNEAELLYNKLIEHASSDHEMSEIYHQLGWVKQDQRKYTDALIFYNKSIEIKRKTTQENSPSLTSTYSNIGQVYNSLGEYLKALEFHEKSLRIQEQTLPSEHPKLAISYSNIGQVYHKMGEYSKALEFYEKALKIRKKTLPPEHPKFANCYDDLGKVYKSMGEYSKALGFYEKALQIKERSLPATHLAFATSYDIIGEVYINMGKYSKALEFHERSLRIKEQTLPSEHSKLATSYSNIGRVCNRMGEYSKALEFHERGLKIQEKTFSPEHPRFADCFDDIGKVYKSMGEYSKALEFYEKALQIKERSLPATHLAFATSYDNIGEVYINMGKYSKALEFHEKSLRIKEQTLPSEHPKLATSYSSIGQVYHKMGEYSKALEFYEKALKIKTKALPSEHPDLVSLKKKIKSIKRNL